jgi:hypothetical protein
MSVGPTKFGTTEALGVCALLFVSGVFVGTLNYVKPQHYPRTVAASSAPAPECSAQLSVCTKLLESASDGRTLWVERERACKSQLADLTEERASIKPVGVKR